MKYFKNGFYILLTLLLSVTISCNEDDDLNIIEGLDFVTATLNATGNKVGVVPSTIPPDGRIVYTVDFGDPMGSEDEVIQQTSGPMVTYSYSTEESATYLITVTASLPGRSDVSITKEHTVIIVADPVDAAGIVGSWKLAPQAEALAVGPGLNDFSWWASNEGTVTERACLFDDKYVFNADGTFQNVQGSDTWLENWQGDGSQHEVCGTPIAPHDGSAVATYTHDEGAGEITIDGAGAYLGIAKAFNGGEIALGDTPPSSITYMAELSGDILELDIEIAGGGYWSFTLVRDVPPEGIVGAWKLAPQAEALAVGPGLNDFSWWASNLGTVTERACLFDDKYVFNADGTFQNVLGSDTWLENWQGDGSQHEVCGAPIAPHDGSASATYSFDETAGEITIDGAGAFLGIAKAYNGGEIALGDTPPSSITYMAELVGETLELDIEIAGGGYWSFTLVRDDTPEPTGVEGTWKIAPQAEALAVGPGLNDFSWWASNLGTVTERACLFDDEYVFNADGTFQNVLGSDTWLENWQGDGSQHEVCGTPIAPHDGSASATYTYDETAGEITINGAGAFLGLAKVFNGGELGLGDTPPSSITYMAELTGEILELDIEIAGGGYWSFTLERQ